MKRNYLYSIFISLIFWHTNAAAGTITAEKNCVVRIEGESYKVGDVLGVYKNATAERPIARLRITKTFPNNPSRSIGRVQRKNSSNCADLNRLTVRALEGKYISPTAQKNKSELEKFRIAIEPALQSLNSKGLHTQPDETVSVSIQNLSIPLAMEIYPLYFSSSSFVSQSLGIGFRYNYLTAMSDIPIETNMGSSSSQKTSGFELDTSFLFRLPYQGNTMQTQIHANYFMSSLKSKLSKTTADLKAAPLRDVEFSGVGLGLYQKMDFLTFLQVSVGGNYLYGLSIKSPKSFNGTEEEQTNQLSDTSQLSALLKTEATFGIYTCALGYKFQSLQAQNKVKTLNTTDSSQTESSNPLNIKSHTISFSVGIKI